MEHEEIAAHTADGHASSGGFPPFDQLDTFPSQIFWLVVTFGFLYFVLSRRLLPKIQASIATREAAIAKDVSEAAALSEKADLAVKAFEQRILTARASSRAAADKTKAEAEALIVAKTAKAEAELGNKLAQAEARIAEMRNAAMGNVASVSEEVAAAIVLRLTGAAPSTQSLSAAVSAARTGN